MHHRAEGRRAVGHRADAWRSRGARARGEARWPSAAATAPGSKRREGAIGFASLRGGTVAGDHDVMFARPGANG